MEKLRIGIIARADNTGLGNLSAEYYKHLEMEKAMIIKRSFQSFPERFNNPVILDGETPTKEQLEEFLIGLDVLLTIETPYNWDTYKIAHKLGVKTVLIPMYEFLPPNRDYSDIDLFLCGSQIDYDVSSGNKVFIPIAVDRDKLPFKKRAIAHTFLHNAGHGGLYGRNGTNDLINAMQYVKSDIKLLINSQFPIEAVKDPRIEVNIANFKNYWDMWEKGDIFILPCKFGGNFLAFNEATSVGMPIITTNFHPHNTIFRKEFLVEPESIFETFFQSGGKAVKVHYPSPIEIAKKIDEWANKDISQHSEEANQRAEQISWKTIKPLILKEFEKLCKI